MAKLQKNRLRLFIKTKFEGIQSVKIADVCKISIPPLATANILCYVKREFCEKYGFPCTDPIKKGCLL